MASSCPMKSKILLLCMLFLAACAQAPKSLPGEETDLSKFDLKGDVKSCTYHAYHQFDDVDTLSAYWQGPLLERVETRFFDVHGMVVFILTEDIDGHSTEVAFFHDDDHRVVEIAQAREPGTILFKESHAYDKDGNRIESLKMEPFDQPERRMTYTYDHNGKLVEERSYHGADTVTSRVVLSYNDAGKVSKISNYIGRTILSSEEVRTYGADGILTEAIETYNGDDHYVSIESRYDREERVIETIMRDHTGGYRKHVFVYGKNGSMDKSIYLVEGNDSSTFVGVDRVVCDEQGRTIEEAFLEPGEDGQLHPLRRLIHRYDEDGRLLETLYLDPDGNREALRTWQYEYDVKGNWVRQVMSYSENSDSDALTKTITITTRKIEYYR